MSTFNGRDPADPRSGQFRPAYHEVTAVAPNGTTTYTIRVTNSGPSSVTGAILSDPAVSGLNKTAVACSATPGQCVTAPTVTQLQSGTFALPALASGQFYEITVTATVTATSGSVTNTATVAAPTGTTDPTPGNNSAADTDTVNPVADLSVTKDDGVTSVNANGTTTYTIRVTNSGPSSVTGAILSDPAVSGLNKTAVACSATPGQCVTAPTVTQLQSGTFALPALASGQFYEITVTATVTATSGSLTNTATVAAPTGTTDPTPGNNSASDTDTVIIPVQVGQIAPTGTTCDQFRTATADTLAQTTYQVKGGTISNAQPGVFFYYVKLTAPSPSFTVTVNQANDQPAISLMHVLNDDSNQIVLWNSSCSKYGKYSVTSLSPASLMISVMNATAGQVFYLSVKYTPKSVIGSPAPNPTTVNYSYAARINSNPVLGSTATIKLVKN